MHWFNVVVDVVAVAFIAGGLAWAGFAALCNYRVPAKRGERPW